MIENLQRENLNPMEEARAYERLAKNSDSARRRSRGALAKVVLR